MNTIEEIQKRMEHLRPGDLAYIIGQLQIRDNRLSQAESDLPYIMAEFAGEIRDGKRWDTTTSAKAFLADYKAKVEEARIQAGIRLDRRIEAHNANLRPGEVCSIGRENRRD